MHLALLLYRQGAGVSYGSIESGLDVSFKARVDTKAEASHLSPRSVKGAFRRLERDGFLVRRNQKSESGRFKAARVYLLNPQTKERLLTRPGEYGLLSSNANDEHFHFITVPRASLDAINGMKHASSKAVYLSALCLASKAMEECVLVRRSLWQELSQLGRNAFSRGLRYCTGKKLFSYKKGVLTLHDPLTGKPTERWRSERVRIQHENTVWRFDLNEVTPEQWRAVVERLLKQAIPAADKWTLSKEIPCPHCGKAGAFSVNFSVAGYICHGCKEKGRLGQLVQRVHGGNMDAAKVFIQESIRESEVALI